MKCCTWSPYLHGGVHCSECCEVFPDWRGRDYHVSLKHHDIVEKTRNIYAAHWMRRDG